MTELDEEFLEKVSAMSGVRGMETAQELLKKHGGVHHKETHIDEKYNMPHYYFIMNDDYKLGWSPKRLGHAYKGKPW